MTTATARPETTKAFKIDFKELEDEKGVFEGYLSVFGNADYGGDVVEKGAFKKTIKDRKSAGKRFKLLWQHDMFHPIGTFDAEEDDYGLKIRAKLTLGVQKADEAYLLMKDGAIDEMSIGYDTIKAIFDKDTGNRILKELKLWEGSLVTFAMNPQATVTGVKSGAALSKASKTAIKSALAQCKAAADELAALLKANGGDDDEEPKDKDEDEKPKSNEIATPSEPSATEAANHGTSAGSKGNDGAGTEPTDAELAEVKALAQQIRTAADEHKALDALRSLKASMSA